jgi:hypothetical protein
MAIDLTIICVTVLIATALVKRIGDRRELERHTITPEELRGLLASNLDVLVVDVRQPLEPVRRFCDHPRSSMVCSSTGA